MGWHRHDEDRRADYIRDLRKHEAPRALDRNDYAPMQRAELVRRKRHAEERLTRADTIEAALADEYTIQEIDAVLAGTVGYFDHSNCGVGKGGPIWRIGGRR